MKDCILVMEPISTGFNYLPDAIARGYQPLVIFPKLKGPEEDVEDYETHDRDPIREKYPEGTIEITDTGNYEELLTEIKKYPVVCVAIGSEVGIELGDRIAYDLHLPGNHPSSSILHRDKDKMHRRLKERGLAYVRGEMVGSVVEAEDFLDRYGLDSVVVKPNDGAGSVGVHLCHGKDEILEAVKNSLTEDNWGAIAGNSTGISTARRTLVQELLVGTQYIVNTISCNGQHYISDIWRDEMIPIADGKDGNAYNYCRLVTNINAMEYDLCRYALNVVDALDIKYGPTHGEYMLTEHGPVLIELGARPMGTSMPIDYMDKIVGHHITDRALDAYFDEALFTKQLEMPYRPLMEAMLKLMIIGESREFDNVPLLAIVSNMESVQKISLGSIMAGGRVERTIDLFTNGGLLYMCHEDSRVLEHDYTVLRSLELSLPELLYNQAPGSSGSVFDENELAQSLESCPISGKTLIFMPEAKEAPKYEAAGMDVVTMDTVFSAKGEYERIFIWLKGLESAPEDKVAAVSALLKLLSPEGAALIPEISVSDSPLEKAEMIAVFEACNVSVQVPNYRTEDYIIGRKK